MNKIFTTITAFLFLQAASAQVTITSSNGWTPGDPFDVMICSATSAMPSSSGANVSVDYSSADQSGGSYNTTCVDPSTTPYSSSYPGATVALPTQDGSSYEYYKTSGTKMELLGQGTAQYTIIYSNPQLVMNYPTAYNDSYSDDFGGSYTVNGVDVHRTGSMQIVADAYGTIKTPKGSYPYLRIKISQQIVDTFIFQGSVLAVSPQNIVTYNYINNNIKIPIFSYSEASTSQGTTKGAYYYNGNLTGVSENNPAVLNGNIFPNPAHQQLSVSFDVKSNDQLNFKIYDINGKVAQTSFQQYFDKGYHTMPFNISGLSAGLYSLVVESTEGNKTTFKFIVQ